MTFHVNRLLGRRFTWNVKIIFFEKLKKTKKKQKNISKCCLLQLWLALKELQIYVKSYKSM